MIITCGETSEFPLIICLHQRALSLYIFASIMNKLTTHIQAEVLWCILFADDIVLVDGLRDGVNAKLKRWRREGLKSKGFKIIRTKI